MLCSLFESLNSKLSLLKCIVSFLSVHSTKHADGIQIKFKNRVKFSSLSVSYENLEKKFLNMK